MRCRTLVVALLVSSPALAERPATEPPWSVDLDTVIGYFDGLQASSLATVRYRPLEQLGLGVSVPFLIGGGPSPDGCWPPGTSCPGHSIQSLGNVAVLATWETRWGAGTRLPVGLLVAFPTSVGVVSNPQFPESYWRLTAAAAMARGLEDGELFAPASFAIVPSVGVLQDLGSAVELSASVRLPVVPSERGALLNGVATVRAMLKVLEESRGALGQLSIGVRAIGAFRIWPYSEYWWRSGPEWGGEQGPLLGERAWSLAFGPRAEARIGPVEVRLGLFVAFNSVRRAAISPGVHLGVGYSF